jgi:hypothetical protein
VTTASDSEDKFLEQVGDVIRSYFGNRGYEHADVWADDLHKRIGDILEESQCRLVAADRWERVRDVAERSACIQRHKAEVFGRDTVSLPEVEQLNEHLKAIYAQLDAAYLRLQSGDLDPMPMGGE